MDRIAHHEKRVMSVAQQRYFKGGAPPPEAISGSWLRCIRQHGLDPARPIHTQVVESAELVEHRERLGGFLDIAGIEMERLYRQINGSGYAVMVTDPGGVIVNWHGDATLTKDFNQAGLWTGAVWSEPHEGTNAIGTCLIEKRPITVHLDEHFLNRNISLSCSACPISDPQGNLLAVLDVSSVNSKDSRLIQSHTLALVSSSAQFIETCYFLERYRIEWVLRFHNRPEFVGVPNDGMLALNGNGRILAVNQAAKEQLGGGGNEQLAGRCIDEVFDVNAEVLMGRATHQINSVWPLRDRRERLFFAMLRAPEHPATGRAALAKPGTDRPVAASLDMGLEGLKGADPCMAFNVRCAYRLLDKDIAILLQGETGTGKEAFAKAIHEASHRTGKPFVTVNCAAIPESLIESELFGYQHGAFTGARRQGMRGKIVLASGGTLFLDEIGDMPLHLQTRLLRVLEEKEVLPLGCTTPISVDLHVISATHRNLPELVARDEFREDLYYRLNGITLTLPALRERADREDLIRCVLEAESDSLPGAQIDDAALAVLLAYTWPGNIRQLRNTLRTAAALCEDGVIRLEDLPAEITRTSPQFLVKLRVTGSGTHQDESALDCAEREALLQALNSHRWNISSTATYLSVSRNTLYRKMKKHGINPPTLG